MYSTREVQAAIQAARRDEHPTWPRWWWLHDEDPMTIRRLEYGGYLPREPRDERWAKVVERQTEAARRRLEADAARQLLAETRPVTCRWVMPVVRTSTTQGGTDEAMVVGLPRDGVGRDGGGGGVGGDEAEAVAG